MRQLVEPLTDYLLGEPITFCGAEDCEGTHDCRACKTIYMRAWRRLKWPDRNPTHTRARAIAYNAHKRGRLVTQPCEDCGSTEAEKHHADYGLPLAVTWLCRGCHLARHGKRLAR